jgi:hypothetical protein
MRKYFFVIFIFFILVSCPYNGQNNSGSDDMSGGGGTVLNTTHPASTVKICFIHHSTGSDWIATGDGNLGSALNANNYYVTECDYGWDAETNDNLGDHTDTEDWPSWFNNTKMPYVYNNNSHFDYTNTIANPGGENEIIMFKSCYPNSEVGNSINDEKAVYNSLLTYFANHLDKMFVLVIPPPEITIDSAALTRELSNWLVDRKNGWLSAYPHKNVYAFNYYTILTHPDSHHHVNSSGYEENVVVNGANELYYYSGSDSHPTAPGHQKATGELLPLLNGWYHLWKGN